MLYSASRNNLDTFYESFNKYYFIITLDKNLIISMEKNRNQDKTEARKENCGNQIANFPTYLGKLIYLLYGSRMCKHHMYEMYPFQITRYSFSMKMGRTLILFHVEIVIVKQIIFYITVNIHNVYQY